MSVSETAIGNTQEVRQSLLIPVFKTALFRSAGKEVVFEMRELQWGETFGCETFRKNVAQFLCL